jgi:hypothetical protein
MSHPHHQQPLQANLNLSGGDRSVIATSAFILPTLAQILVATGFFRGQT